MGIIVCFRINKKIPRGPPSPPAPVMHSPSRKVQLSEMLESFYFSVLLCYIEKLTKKNIAKDFMFDRVSPFVVDDSQGAAGVEDSSMHLQLEKR